MNGKKFPEETLQNLVESLPRRVEAVVATKKWTNSILQSMYLECGAITVLVRVMGWCPNTFVHILFLWPVKTVHIPLALILDPVIPNIV